MKKLIITADDYGYLDHIDEAIIDLAQNYRISSVSCFANIPYSQLKEKIEKLLKVKYKLQENGKDLGIGLHFTITSGSPLCGESSLTDCHGGKLKFRELRDHGIKEIKEEDIKKELKAQKKNLEAALQGNAVIDHVSCHHNICYFKSSYFRAYASTIKKFDVDIPIRSPLRWVRFNPVLKGEKKGRKALRKTGWKNRFKGSVNQLAYTCRKGMNRLLRITYTIQLKSPTYFFSEFYDNPDFSMANALSERLREDTSCEIIVHVSKGLKNSDCSNFYHGINELYFEGRKKEFDFFRLHEKGLNFYKDPEINLNSYFNHLK